MAQTTFTGPVVALNGFIGGANNNTPTKSNDTQQGGGVAWTVSNASTVTIASGTRSGETLSAVGNEGVMIYVSNGYTGNSVYAFSDGTTWKQVITGTDITAS
jgi:hypothetical protein